MLLEERVGQAVTEAEAKEFARELYGLVVSAKSLPGEYDDNFQLTNERAGAEGAGGLLSARAFVLKAMHPARERDFIDMQCRALQHLAERAPQLLLPRVCPTKNGDNFTEVVMPDGSRRIVWLLTYVQGKILAEVRPHADEILTSLGRLLGEMDAALADFSHPAAHRELKWDFARAGWIKEHVALISDAARRALVEKFIALYESEVVPGMAWLRRSVVYGDANDYNVLVGEPWPGPREAISVIDFGDLHHSFTVSEAAIAAAYAMLGKKDPLRVAATVVAGYHHAFALTEPEIAVLYALIGTRLAVSVVNSAMRATVKPDDAYVTISEAPAWEALERLAGIHSRLAHYAFREACGLPPVPKGGAVQRWLAAHAPSAAPLLDVDLRTAPSVVFDWSVGSKSLGANPAALNAVTAAERIFAELKSAHVSVGLGRYNEARLCYTSPLFGPASGAGDAPTDERRTIHLGMDVFAAPGSAVYAPLQGTVHAFADNTTRLDYGPVVILRHAFRDGSDKKARKEWRRGARIFHALWASDSRHAAKSSGGASHSARGEIRAHRKRAGEWRLATASSFSGDRGFTGPWN